MFTSESSSPIYIISYDLSLLPLWTSRIIFIVFSLYLSYSYNYSYAFTLSFLLYFFVYHVLIILDLYFVSSAAV